MAWLNKSGQDRRLTKPTDPNIPASIIYISVSDGLELRVYLRFA